jgi:hypothetical protein
MSMVEINVRRTTFFVHVLMIRNGGAIELNNEIVTHIRILCLMRNVLSR